MRFLGGPKGAETGLHGTKPGCRLILRRMQIHPDASVHGDPGMADPGDGPQKPSSLLCQRQLLLNFEPKRPRKDKESEGGIARLVHLRAHHQAKDAEHVADLRMLWQSLICQGCHAETPTACDSRAIKAPFASEWAKSGLQGAEGCARQTRRTIFTFKHFSRQGINGEAMGRSTYSSDCRTKPRVCGWFKVAGQGVFLLSYSLISKQMPSSFALRFPR